MDKIKAKRKARLRRHLRVRRKVFGTAERPRLSVFKSNTGIYAQIIDDTEGRTLVSASSIDKGLRKNIKKGSDKKAAAMVGTLVAQRALAKSISEVVFDRGGFLYHGRIKALADSVREAGLRF